MHRRLLSSSWPAFALGAGATLLAVLDAGVQPGAAVRYVLYLAFGITVPGVFAWRLLLAETHKDEGAPPTWFEDLTLGTIFGFAVQLPVYLAGVAVGVPLLVLALPALVVVLSLLPFGRRTWTMPTGRVDSRLSWGLAAVVTYGMVFLSRNALTRRPLALPPHQTPSHDETFHQALVAELSHRLPPEMPFLLGVPMDYHWFAHAQIATVRWVTGIDAVVMLRVLVPTVTLVLAVLGLAAVAVRLTGRHLAGFVAPALLVAGAFHAMGPLYQSWVFTEPFLSKRILSSPSQSYGYMASMPALMLLLKVLRPSRRAGALTWVTLALTLMFLAGSKVTFLPIFVCAGIGVWFLRLVLQRRVDWSATALVVVLLLATGFGIFVLYGGNTGVMAFDPFETVEAALRTQGIPRTQETEVFMSWAILTSWLLYGLGAVGLFVKGMWRDPRALWILVAVPTGITVPFVYFRPGLSQLWFARSVAELVVLLSAWGVVCLVPRMTRRSTLLLGGAAFAGSLVAFGISVWVWATKAGPSRLAPFDSVVLTALTPPALVVACGLGYLALRLLGVRWRSAPLATLVVLLGLGAGNVYSTGFVMAVKGQREPPLGRPMFAKGGAEAARYIAEHSPPDAIVATNVHCAEPKSKRCDNRSFWVAAYTERRVVVEGWGYTAPTNRQERVENAASRRLPMPFPLRLEVNDAVFEHPYPETLERLVDAYGVDWLFVSKRYPADLRGLRRLDQLERRYRSRHYVVYEVLVEPDAADAPLAAPAPAERLPWLG